MTSLKNIRLLSALIAFLSLILVALGGYVRATGAGLSCPDWPLCFGRIVPDFAQGVTQEYLHRVLAGLVGLLMLGLMTLAYRARREQPRFFWVSIFLLLLVTVQAVFGGLTVTMKLNPHVVSTHLLLGTLFLQLIALIPLERVAVSVSGGSGKASKNAGIQRLTAVLCVLVFLQVVLGGFVGSSGASLACPDFPLCFGALIPETLAKPQVVQLLHRVLGTLIFIGIVALVISAVKSPTLERKRRGHIFGMLFLVTVQILLGAINVWYQLPISGTILHLVVAQLLLFGLIYLYQELHGGLRFFWPNLSKNQFFVEQVETAKRARNVA